MQVAQLRRIWRPRGQRWTARRGASSSARTSPSTTVRSSPPRPSKPTGIGSKTRTPRPRRRVCRTSRAPGLSTTTRSISSAAVRTRWYPPGCACMRAQVLSLREKEYVEAARALGAQAGRIMVRHILPNSLTAIVVVATLQFAQVIVTEAALSFLGLGVPLDTPSWGGMLNDGQSYLGSAWWVATLPGVAISMTVLSVNLMGDWLGDLLNSRLRR